MQKRIKANDQGYKMLQSSVNANQGLLDKPHLTVDELQGPWYA